MAITQNDYIGNGVTEIYSFSFPYLKRDDVFVRIDGVVQTVITDYSFESEQTIRFVNAPADQSRITIFRVTNTDELEHVFYPGSAIRAKDLNNDYLQTLFVAQETQSDLARVGEGGVSDVNGQTGNVLLGIDNLDDVYLDSIADGNILVYDALASKWINKPNEGSGGGGPGDVIAISGGEGINATTDSSGDVTIAVNIADTDSGLEFSNAKLTAKSATAFELGSVRVGNGLDVTLDGTLNSIFDPSQLDGEYLSLSPFVGAQTVLTSSTTEFLGQVGLPGGGSGTQAIQKQEVEALINDLPVPIPDLTPYVEKAGSNMTGQLGLPGGGAYNQAIQKQEVEALIDLIPPVPIPDLSFFVEKSGSTMTGQLGLPGNGGSTQAIQKQEVEALIAASGGSGPGPDLTAYVEKSGSTMTGQLTLPGGGSSTQALQKQEVQGLPVSTFSNDSGYITAADIPAPVDPVDPNLFVEKTGSTMTGNLQLPGGGGDTAALQKQEIETLISLSGGGVGPTFSGGTGTVLTESHSSVDTPTAQATSWDRENFDDNNLAADNRATTVTDDGAGTLTYSGPSIARMRQWITQESDKTHWTISWPTAGASIYYYSPTMVSQWTALPDSGGTITYDKCETYYEKPFADKQFVKTGDVVVNETTNMEDSFTVDAGINTAIRVESVGKTTTQVLTCSNDPPWVYFPLSSSTGEYLAKFFGPNLPNGQALLVETNILTRNGQAKWADVEWVLSGNTATRTILNADGDEEYSLVTAGDSIVQDLFVTLTYNGVQYETIAKDPRFIVP